MTEQARDDLTVSARRLSDTQVFLLCTAGANVVMMALVHAIWLYAWHVLGYRPSFGHPESWSSPPLTTVPALKFLVVPYFMSMWYGPPFCIVVTIWVLARRRSWNMALVMALLWLSYALLWWDPWGAANWYLD